MKCDEQVSTLITCIKTINKDQREGYTLVLQKPVMRKKPL